MKTEKMTTEQIVKKLYEAKEAYYSLGEPIMPDDEFDDLEDNLKKIDPGNEYFKLVGIGNIKEKVKHDVPMLSLSKAKTVEEVLGWVEKHNIEDEVFIIQPKIDGLSCSVVYENGKLSLVKTRGDGSIGQNITHISNFVNIPKVVKDPIKIEVRGELYLPKNTKLANPENKPLRNVAVGLINRKDAGLENLRYIHFVAYQVLGQIITDSVAPHLLQEVSSYENYKLKWLEENEFEAIWWGGFSKLQISLATFFEEYLEKFRDSWLYESDGLVITVNNNKLWDKIDSRYEVSHHHHYNIALKPPSQGKETILEGVEWNVSRQGKVIPVALVRPIILGGTTVSRCTLNNYENVLNLKLHIGDKVLIERAGDVIPFFKENLSTHSECGKDIIPTHCPSCDIELKVGGVHLVCGNSLCKEPQVLKIVHWVRNCEMEQFSEASVRALFNAGKLWDIVSLYNLDKDDFTGVSGFASSKINNALDQIEATKEMTIGQFVDRLGIDLVGEKAMKKLGITTIDQLLNFNDSTFVIGRNLIEFLKDNKTFVNQLLQVVIIKQPQEVKMGSKNVCMTGKGPKTRNDLIVDIQVKGDQFVDHVGKGTDILVCEDPNSNSSKLQKAQ